MMKRFQLPLLILFSAVLLLFGCDAGGGQTSTEHTNRAQSHLDEGEHRAALIELKNALLKNPDNTQARLLMGQLHVTLGDGASAEKELLHASELGVDAESTQTHLARAYLMQGKFKEISELVPTSEMTSGTHAELLALRGMALLNQEKLEEAEAEFEQALMVDSDSVEATVGLARLAMVRGDGELARQNLEKAFGLDEHDAAAWSLLGDLEQADGNLAAAEEAYTTASENRVANTEDILNRVIMRIALGQYDQAAADIKQLKRRGVNVSGIHYVEGLLYFAQQRYPDAQTSFEKVLSLDSQNLPVLFYLGAASFMQESLAQAEHYLSRFDARRPDYVPARKMLAWIKLQSGDFDEAQRLIQPVVDKNPEDVFALKLLADALMRENKTTEGLSYLKQVVALQPDSGTARMNLGMGLVMSGETSAGIEELEKAEALYPESEVATIKIIKAHLANKSFDEALKASLAYRENHPDSITAHILLGTSYMTMGDSANAGKVFEEALVIEPGNISANSGLAAIALQSGDLDKAKGYYRDAIEKHPGALAPSMNLAAVEHAQGNFDAMQDVLNQAISANPDALAPRLSLSRFYLKRAQHQKIIELLSPVRDNNADNPEVRGLLGESELAVGDYTRAVDDLSHFVKLVPKNAQAHYSLARAYAGDRDRNGYYRELKTVVELDEKHINARTELIKLMLAEKNTAEAGEHIEILKSQAEDQPEALTLEGKHAALTGNTQRAIEVYQQALDVQKTNFNLLRLEDVLWQAGKRDDAVKLLETWAQEYPDDSLTLAQLAGRYLALEQEERAIATYERVYELAPDNVIALNNLAWLYLERDSGHAIEYAEKAYSLAPESPEIIDTTAMVVYKRDSARAKKLIERALDKKPDNPTFLFHKALILKEHGNTEEAMQIVQSLVEQNREFPEKGEARRLLKELGGN